MDWNDRTETLIRAHLELIMNQGESLGDSLGRLAEFTTQTLLNDGKVLTAANGACNTIAQVLTTAMTDHFEFERPGFPAINLGNDHILLSQYAKDGAYHDSISRQIRTLGTAGDLLIVYSIDGKCSNLIQAIQAAHEKGMTVAIFAGPDENNLCSLTYDTDFTFTAGTNSKARVLELQLLATHILLDLIDCQLFGIPEHPDDKS